MGRFAAVLGLLIGLQAPGLALPQTTTTTTTPPTTLGTPTCGNGSVEGAEECDDGNTDPGDCCSPTCLFELAGTPCSENDPCYAATGAACDGSGACRPGPMLLECFGYHMSYHFRFVLQDLESLGGDKVAFRKKTAHGFADLLAALGDPAADTTYSLCIYETIPFQPEPSSLLSSLSVRTGAAWTRLPDGWKYKNPRANGVRRLQIRERRVKDSTTVGYRLRFLALGKNLPLPGPIDASRYFALEASGIAAAVVNETGFCASVSCCDALGIRVKENTAERFVLHYSRPRD